MSILLRVHTCKLCHKFPHLEKIEEETFDGKPLWQIFCESCHSEFYSDDSIDAIKIWNRNNPDIGE